MHFGLSEFSFSPLHELTSIVVHIMQTCLLAASFLLLTYLSNPLYYSVKPRLHGDSDPDPDPDWLRLHEGELDSNPDSDHLSHICGL